LGAAASAQSVSTDDTALFSTAVAPNVVLLVDNSGSMNNVVWHPAFDFDVIPACNKWDNDDTSVTFSSETTASFNSSEVAAGCKNDSRVIFLDPEVTTATPSEPTRWHGRYLNWYHSAAADPYVADIQSTTNGSISSCLQLELPPPYTYPKYRRSRIAAARLILHDVICRANQTGAVRFGIARFRDGYSGDPQGGFMITEVDDYTPSHAAELQSKIDALAGYAWTPLAETLYTIYSYFMSRTDADRPCGIGDPTCASVGSDPEVRFDQYDLDLNGNTTTSLLDDPMYDSASGLLLECRKNFVIILTDGEPSKDDFDSMERTRFQTKLIGDYVSDIAQPYPENFNHPGPGSPETLPFDATYHSELASGTYGHDDDVENNYETALYLDDVAGFMHGTDFRPDIDNDQTIDVYTVGFSTSPYANAVLQKAADSGGGTFYFSNNAEELADAISSALSSIITKSQQFTAASVPASRASDGNAFFTSYFVPLEGAFWEGHLKQFEFNATGEIRDAQNPSECALDDPNSTDPVTGPCQQGPLKLSAPGYWDAATEIPPATEGGSGRKLYTSIGEGTRAAGAPVDKPTTFVEANLSAADLNVGSGTGQTPVLDFDGVDGFDATAPGVDADSVADDLVAYARGCDFGSDPCDERGTPSAPRLLADIFHSNPIVVGPPSSSVNNSSYHAFAENYKTRSKVIYAGSNGGFVHGFDAGDWQTSATTEVPYPPGYDRGSGAERMGFMSYAARQNLPSLPLQTEKAYFMDGSQQAADVWLYPNATAVPASASEWHTAMIGGMRQGGRVVWALDVTDPDGAYSQPEYPGYLWEFPCEASSCDALRPLMGETWSHPIITRVRVTVDGAAPAGAPGYDRWVAIFGGGYDVCGDPHSLVYGQTASGEPCENNVAGRAIFMVDIATGEVLAKKVYSASSGDYTQEMEYAIASRPAVFDLNFDGYADVIYIGDLGGNLWKWVIDDIVEDPIHTSGTPDTDPDEWEFVRLFEGVECPDGTGADQCDGTRRKSFFEPPTGALLHGSLFLAFGSGERQNLEYLGDASTDLENNRYYMLRDADPYEHLSSAPLDTSARFDDAPSSLDFVDVTNVSGCAPPAPPAVGYYFRGDDGEKFITSSLIFLGSVFTGSYYPSDPATPCESGGTAYFYGFDLFCGEGVLPPSGAPEDPPERRVQIGTGLPNAPRMSVGPLEDQDPGGPGNCGNTALGLSSSGEVFGFEAECIPNRGVRVKSWRED
jgi:type IV pilus assembly protein PilY1